MRGLLLLFAVTSVVAQDRERTEDPVPATIEEFQRTATRILQETGVPGAGISLVRADKVEWEGGIGLADRDRKTPVTADTHFRVGSVSKTFVAIALVQLAEDGELDLDATVEEIAPEVQIDNPWHLTDPVRVIHLLQHTAGFDDMHFNEIYTSEADLPLVEVLKHNPASRRVRWRPGTRMAYSNPGYGVAGYLIEKLTEQPYSDYIRDEIFLPLEMKTSSFELTAEDKSLLASGYAGPQAEAVGFPGIYMRPAGNMHSSARELGRFVRMLLNWGELDTAFVVDPEYLGSMEQPRTTIASGAGLRNGYGTGIFTSLNLPYRVLGHDGGIEGFVSSYGYSPTRDVGFVVLLNSGGGGAGRAAERLKSLAIRFLKRDVEPPVKPEVTVPAETLDRYLGYYHDANPRHQFVWGLQWLLSGRTVVREGDRLYEQPTLGARQRLIPVSDTLFRREEELDASRVFTLDDHDQMVLAGVDVYAPRRSRWDVEIVRVPVILSVLLMMSVVAVAIVWVARIRRASPRGFWMLKLTLLLCPVALAMPIAGLSLTRLPDWGTKNAGTMAVYLGTLALPAFAVLALVLSVDAARKNGSRWLLSYAVLIALAAIGLSVYLRASDLLGIRLWMY